MEALVNLPVLVTHGDQDQSVNVNLSRYLVRMLQRWGYDVRYIEVPGKGHTELGLWDETISWLLQHKRNASPKHARVRAADLRDASAYWVEVTQKRSPFEFAVVDAEALDGNIIRVDSKNVDELVLTPSKSLVDFSKPVRVAWNGKIIPVNGAQAQKIVLREDDYKPLSLCKNPDLAGPISDFQNTPFMIVIGTISNDSLMKKIIKQKADVITGDWKTAQKYEPRVKNDVDVTDADMKSFSLFLLGGPEENAVSKRVFDRIPVQMKPGEILIDGRSFNAKDAVLNAIYLNPFNQERYVDIVASTSGPGFFFFDPRKRDLFEYDFCITDGKIPCFSVGAKNEKIFVASGFFNHDWKIEDALLNRGDEELRAKCAQAVINNDLTMTVVSNVKPSPELLKSCVGTYQIENGPQVRIYLEDGTLKAAQGQFSAGMVATGENEFYVKEANASISFVKDEATNDYIMIVYQNGGEFKSKKVK
jgi:hypothetical protein